LSDQLAWLAGETIGYVRLRGSRLAKQSSASTTPRSSSTVRDERSQVDVTLFTPRIVSPAPDACVWERSQSASSSPRRRGAFSLQLPDGKKVSPQKRDRCANDGPLRRALFTVDASQLGGGPCD